MRGQGRRGRKRRKKDARDGGGGEKERRGKGHGQRLPEEAVLYPWLFSLSLLGVVPCEPSRWVGRTRTC